MWISQSWFSLGFFSQNYLWKLSTFRGYKGIYSRVHEKCEKSFFYKTGHSGDSLTSGMSHELTARPDCQFLSCSAPVVMTLQLLACFTHMAFYESPVARSSRKNPLNTHTLEFFTLFSYKTLALFPPKYRVLNCWNTSKFVME